MTTFTDLNMMLVPVRSNDHWWLVELHNDPAVLRNLTNPQPITIEQHMAWWSKIVHDDTQLRLIFTVNGTRVGFTKFYYIDAHNKCCVLGADIHKDYRGKGYAKHMWSLMLDHCFSSLGCHRVCLTTADYNDVAQHIYKKLGFKEEGRLTQSLYRDGKFHDQILMYMLRDDWESRAINHD